MTRINQGKHILKMIEEVDPNDTEILDQVDARFWCFSQGYEFHPYKNKDLFAWDHNGNRHIAKYETVPNYTRSLDALKAVEEEYLKGWQPRSKPCPMFPHLKNYCCTIGNNIKRTGFNSLPTMELAWLHAIIQAYIWEIENG